MIAGLACSYASCKLWTLTAELQRRIQTMEMRCYRKILRISYKDQRYQRGSPCQDPAGNRSTRRPPNHRKETRTAVVWSYLPFMRSGQNHLARHSERGKKTRQTEEEGGKTTSGNGQAWSSPSPKGQWRKGKNGGNWLRNHLWCPNDPRGRGIDDDVVVVAAAADDNVYSDQHAIAGRGLGESPTPRNSCERL